MTDLTDRLAALGIESEAVREYDTWAEAPPAIYQSSILMQDKADAAIESLLDEVERLQKENDLIRDLAEEYAPHLVIPERREG